MRISFILPPPVPFPIGGHKVVYEYAGRLAQRGHDVTVSHVLTLRRSRPLPLQLWDLFRYRKLTRQIRSRVSWFEISPKVRLLALPRATPLFLPTADVTIATAWDTSSWIARCPARIRGRGFYLIQHVEDWETSRQQVLQTWKLPLHKIVIAGWLRDIATDLGESCTHIPNGLDFHEFGMDTPPEKRPADTVSLLWHHLPVKGSEIALEALEQVRRSRPGLHLECFGTSSRPEILPAWADYRQCPSRSELRALYNRSAIFVAPSLSEGWGLTPCEAMMCSACVVATDIGGHREFCEPGQNCLLVPPSDPASLRDAVLRAIDNGPLRIQLALRGQEMIQRFTWEKAVVKLEETLMRTV